ncbi:hypothetical protein L208DRAFT_1476129 [Tricholoma matsutake]|nr:hypothetical protein L208DRAFT_1476129 [Tricholoma matsutake 945]
MQEEEEEEGEEGELLPEGGGSVNIAIMKICSLHEAQTQSFPGYSTAEQTHVHLAVETAKRQGKGIAKGLNIGNERGSGVNGWAFLCEWAIIAAFDISNTMLDNQSHFDYYNSAASFDSEAPQLLDTLEDLQKADPETRSIQATCKQTIMLSPAANEESPHMHSKHPNPSDWLALLTFMTFWQLGITFAVKDIFPSCMLYYPLLISKEAKDFIIRKIIYLAMLGQMATFYQEPEPFIQWFSTTLPPAGFTPGLSSTPHTIPMELPVEPSSAGSSQANMSDTPNHILHLNCSAPAASSSTRSTTKHSKQKTNEMDDKFFLLAQKSDLPWPS